MGIESDREYGLAVLRTQPREMAGNQQPAVLSAIGKLNAAKQKFGEGAAAVRSAINDTDKYHAVL